MRTWFHALPPAHHAPAASLRRILPDSLAMTKSASGAGLQPVNRYALAKRTGCPEGITARRTAPPLA